MVRIVAMDHSFENLVKNVVYFDLYYIVRCELALNRFVLNISY